MQQRCPSVKVFGVSVLRGYSLRFNRYSNSWQGGTAAVEPTGGAIVEGVIYEISGEDLHRLDVFECVDLQHYRRTTCSLEMGEKEVTAWLYLARAEGTFLPSKKYINQMRLGAKQHGLSREYLELLDKVEEAPE